MFDIIDIIFALFQFLTIKRSFVVAVVVFVAVVVVLATAVVVTTDSVVADPKAVVNFGVAASTPVFVSCYKCNFITKTICHRNGGSFLSSFTDFVDNRNTL